MKKHTNKGQVALEFLMTYGWALLVLSIAIGAFAYIRVTPEEIVGSSCSFTDGLYCLAHKFDKKGITLEVQNNVGRPINVTRVECTFSNQKNITDINPNIRLRPGSINASIICKRDDLTMIGELISANVVVYYLVDDYSYPRSVEGNVVGYVLEK